MSQIKKIIFVTLIVSLSCGYGAYSDSCVVQECPSVPDGVAEPVLTLLQIPSDCTKFIKCERGFPHVMNCPSGLHFNDDLKVCDWPNSANCVACTGTTVSETDPITETTAESIVESSTDSNIELSTIIDEASTGDETDPGTGTGTSVCADATETNYLFPVVDDCTKFYSCSNGVPYTMNCPDGLHFNVEIKVCDWPADAKCTASGTTVGTTAEIIYTTPASVSTTEDLIITEVVTTPEDVTTTEAATISEAVPPVTETVDVGTGGDPEAGSVCAGATETNYLFPMTGDCTKFISCSNGVPYTMNCPSGLHFNVELSVCDWPADAKCTASGTPITTIATDDSSAPVTTLSPEVEETTISSLTTATNTGSGSVCAAASGDNYLFPIATDCTKFISCSNGVPYTMNCPSGLHFNVALKVCDWPADANCIETEITTAAALTTSDTPIDTTPGDEATVTDLITEITTDVPVEDTTFEAPTEDSSTTGVVVDDSTIVPDDSTTPELTITDAPADDTTIIEDSTTEGSISPDSTTSDVIVDTTTELITEESAIIVDDTTTELVIEEGSTDDTTTELITDEESTTESIIVEDSTTTASETVSTTVAASVCAAAIGDKYLFPYATDCTKFISCSNGVPYTMNCPAGLHFNVALSVCDWPADAKCTASGAPITTIATDDSSAPVTTLSPEVEETTISSLTTATNTGSGSVCAAASGDNYLFPIATDCTKFISCSNGVPYTMNCPAGLHFNVALKVCDWPADANCIETEITTAAALTTSDTPIDTTPGDEAIVTDLITEITTDVPVEDTTFEAPTEDSSTTGIAVDDSTIVPDDSTTPELTITDAPADDTTIIEDSTTEGSISPDSTTSDVIVDTTTELITEESTIIVDDTTTELVIEEGSTDDTTTELITDEESTTESIIVEDSTTTASETVSTTVAASVCAAAIGDKYLFPYATDCTKFISCSNGVPYTMNCPAGLHFNVALSVCDWPADAKCTATEETEPEIIDDTTTIAESVTDGESITELVTEVSDTTASEIVSTSVCTAATGTKYLFPFANDCTKFISCSNGVPYTMNCPLGLHFNAAISVCDWPADAKCATTVTSITEAVPAPETPTESVTTTVATTTQPSTTQAPLTGGSVCAGATAFNYLFPVPNDCTKFISCSNGVPYTMNCPAGLHFNVAIKVCDWPWNANCSDTP